MIRILIVAGGITLVFGVGAIGAGTPPLPQGNGLAARYPGDAGIASDPDVIFVDNFESYTNASGLWGKWSNLYQASNTRIATESGNFFGGGKALEFTIPPLTNAEVANAVEKTVSPELDVLFLRYYTKYDLAFNFAGSSHNGGAISAHYCCPGVKADGYNKFGASYEASRFDTSIRNPGELNAYVYHPDQRDGYGDHFYPNGTITPYSSNPPFTFGPEFVPRPQVVPVLGRWYAFELMVKANTPGQRDGRIALWLDGNLIADFLNLRLRETTSLTIDHFSLQFHMKGNNPGIVRQWYDNVVAARSYIGPAASGSPQVPRAPTNLRIISGD